MKLIFRGLTSRSLALIVCETAGILGSVPVAVAYSFFVDNYVSGLTAGATKG